MRFFPPRQVTLLDGPFRDALLTGLRYVLALEVDRLAAPFLREAGLTPRAAPYGNWESSGLDGHIGGHYLSATARLAVATGDPEPRRRLDRLVGELARAQAALGTGYVGGVPGGAALFDGLRTGGLDAAERLGTDAWVPWYNVHKTFAGLLDAVALVDSADARHVVLRLADWGLDLARDLDEATFEAMLATEFGGMNDAYARLAALTGRAEYAAMARRFAHRALLEPLLARRDELTGLHANTQIPKVVGYASTAALDGDPELLGAVDHFWCEVVGRRSAALGGNSLREHFSAVDDMTAMVEEREGPETCNTVNMLKLTRALAEAAFEPAHLDYAERALYNHVLASQHPDGGFVYFTSLRPRHYRVYSQAEQGFWCCVGTGMEAQASSGDLVFGDDGGALAVNLFVPAVLDAPELGGRFRLETAFPAAEQVALVLDLDAPRRLAVRLRVPAWSAGLRELAVDGIPVEGLPVEGGVVVERDWRPGQRITFRVPLEVRAERLPDGSAWRAFLAGPVLLAARDGSDDLAGLRADDSRMGHIAGGRLERLGTVPIVAERPAAEVLERLPSDALRFRLRLADPAGDVVLEPFFALHDARYTVYWPSAPDDAASLGARRAELTALDEGSLELDRLTIDRVRLGEQQPESDHAFRGPGSVVGRTGGATWRTTRSSMSLRLVDPEPRGWYLRVSYQPLAEPTAVVVTIDDIRLAEERVDAGAAAFDQVYYLERGPARSHVVAFRAIGDASTPGIATVRLQHWA